MRRRCGSWWGGGPWMTGSRSMRWIPASGRATTPRPARGGGTTTRRRGSRPASRSSPAGRTCGWRRGASPTIAGWLPWPYAGCEPERLARALGDLDGERVAVLVRLRSGRCFYADPDRQPRTGRPRRHGRKLACDDPTTWWAPTAEHHEEHAQD